MTLNFFFLEPPRSIEAKFYVEPPWDRVMKASTNGLCHVTNMAVMPIYGKKLKIHVLWNQKTDDLEIWYAAAGTRVLPTFFK